MEDKASLGQRLGAYLIDLIPIMVATLVVGSLFGVTQELVDYLRDPDDADRADFLRNRNIIRDTSFVVYLLYAEALEVSPWRATLGKRAVGIRPLDKGGATLTPWRATARNVSKIVSLLPFGLGFVWAIFDKHNRGWHDLIAGTYVAQLPQEGPAVPTRPPDSSAGAAGAPE